MQIQRTPNVDGTGTIYIPKTEPKQNAKVTVKNAWNFVQAGKWTCKCGCQNPARVNKCQSCSELKPIISN